MKMPHHIKTGAVQVVAALLLAGMFTFSAVVVPEHLAWHESNEHCIICRLIQHVPLLDPGAVTDIAQLFQHKEFLFISDDAIYRDPKLISNFSSRAPPLS